VATGRAKTIVATAKLSKLNGVTDSNVVVVPPPFTLNAVRRLFDDGGRIQSRSPLSAVCACVVVQVVAPMLLTLSR